MEGVDNAPHCSKQADKRRYRSRDGDGAGFTHQVNDFAADHCCQQRIQIHCLLGNSLLDYSPWLQVKSPDESYRLTYLPVQKPTRFSLHPSISFKHATLTFPKEEQWRTTAHS